MTKKTEEKTDDIDPIADMLLAPFHPSEIDYKPGATSESTGKGLVLAYIDARDVATRLDAVVGYKNWEDGYTILDIGSRNIACLCRLTINGFTKEGIGEGSLKDEEPFKSAESDAFKRAGVKFGVGRFLYYLPRNLWLPYDRAKKRFTEKPGWGNDVLFVAASQGGWKGTVAPERPTLDENQGLNETPDSGYDSGYTTQPEPRERPKPSNQPENKPGDACSVCEKGIPPAVATFSMKRFGQKLCIAHQKEAEPVGR